VGKIRGKNIMQRTHTALIVDDNFYNRDVAALALSHVGFEVTHADNGEDALKELNTHSFDLLILDLQMDGMDGASVLRRVRAQRTTESLCVVIMTANPHMLTNEVNNQADYVMYKPISINEFAQLAKRILNPTESRASVVGDTTSQ
jgi:CheY-like chemotaxis protein